MRMPAGTGAAPHSHPNEQWIYILEGIFHATSMAKISKRGPARDLRSADVMHSGKAGADGDVVFFTVKTPRTACTASRPRDALAAAKRDGEGEMKRPAISHCRFCALRPQQRSELRTNIPLSRSRSLCPMRRAGRPTCRAYSGDSTGQKPRQSFYVENKPGAFGIIAVETWRARTRTVTR